MIAQENRRSAYASLLRNLDNRLSTHDGSSSAAQRAVRYDVDALLVAEIDNLLLGEIRVVLDLVDGGDDFAVREELFEVFLAVLYDGTCQLDELVGV